MKARTEVKAKDRIHSFRGGVHPPDSKTVTAGFETQVVWPKTRAELVYPMRQHIGAPARIIAEKGEHVLLGQKIGESDGNMSAPVHASVSGTVKEIRDVLTPTGLPSKAVVIENDGNNKEHPSIVIHGGFDQFSRQQILDMIREAGIVGLGGAGFPTHIKLDPPKDKSIDTIIVNAAECEPYLTTDYRVLLEENDKLIDGLRILLKLHPKARGIIAVETNKMDAIRLLQEKVKPYPGIDVIMLKPKYPQGSEKQLIYACTGREVPSGKLPADVGCIVNNVDTVIAVHRAIVRGRPLMRKIVTVSGGAVQNPGNYKIRIGMKFADLMELIGGFREEPAKIICGGPMMGVAVFSHDVPLIKTSSAFLCLTEREAVMPPEQNCIRCGRCVDICPSGLMPLVLNRDAINADPARFRQDNGMDCIECGSCSYVCPAKRHLTQSIRTMRRDLLSKR